MPFHTCRAANSDRLDFMPQLPTELSSARDVSATVSPGSNGRPSVVRVFQRVEMRYFEPDGSNPSQV